MPNLDQQTATVLSAIAVVVAAVIAATVGFYGNLRIKHFEDERQRERERAKQRLTFYLPLLRSCTQLDRRIGRILGHLHDDWLSKTYLQKIQNLEGFAVNPNEKGYFFISSIYYVACFFGWAEAIKQGCISEAVSTNVRLR